MCSFCFVLGDGCGSWEKACMCWMINAGSCTGLAHGLVWHKMTRMEVVDVSADASRWDAPSSAAVKAVRQLAVQSSERGQAGLQTGCLMADCSFYAVVAAIWRFYLCVVLLVM